MGVRLATSSGLAAPSIAEFVMGRLLAEWKHFRTLDAQQHAHVWTQQLGAEVAGRTLGIVGLGSLGRAIARRAKAFDMMVLATRASAQPGDTDPDVDELHPASTLDELLPRCDAVVATLPANESTFDMFDASRFGAMAEGAVFVNVSRGSLVVEPDLVESLRSGHLRAAVLDVTRVEPLPADDPLWDAPNLYLSPHTSTSLDRYADNLVDLAADNLNRFVEGQPLRNEVDLAGR
jgi:phosphoglycerate dehydrogenase-like enzyme